MIDSSPIPAIPASTPPLKLLYTPVEAGPRPRHQPLLPLRAARSR
jgi:hypothetical protein